LQYQFSNKKNRRYPSINSILGTRKKYEYKKERINSYMIDSGTLNFVRRNKKIKIKKISIQLGLSESYVFRVFSGQCGMKTEKLRELCTLLDLEFTKIVKGAIVNYE